MVAKAERNAVPRSAPEQRSGVAEVSEIARRRSHRRSATNRVSDERWKQILQAGSRVFRDVGYTQATLENVAVEANVNRATLYYYVSSKADLLVALLEGVLEQFMAEVERICDLPIEPPDKLRRVIAAHVRSLDEHPEHFIYLAENVDKIITIEGEVILAFGHTFGEHLRTIIEQGIRGGAFRADLDARVAMLALTGMLAWIHRWYAPDGANTLSEIGEQFADIAIGGMAAPG